MFCAFFGEPLHWLFVDLNPLEDYNDSTHLPVTSTPFLIIPWHLIIVVLVLMSMIISWRVVRRRRHGGGRRSAKATAPSPWASSGSGI